MPLCRIRAVQELLQGDFRLAQENNVDRFYAEVILSLLYMRPSGQYLHFRRQGFQFSRQA